MNEEKKTRSKKTPTVNTVIRPLSKRNWAEVIGDASTGYLSYNNNTVEYIARLKLTMRLWADHPTSLSIIQFCNEYKIDYSHMQALYKKFPDFKEFYVELKRTLGERRKIGALTRQFNVEAVFRDIHLFDPDWKIDVDKYHDDRKKELNKDFNDTFGHLAGIIDFAKLSYSEKEQWLSKKKEA